MGGFARVVDAPMYGLELDGRSVTANVSDAFTARYELEARALDPVRARALASGAPAYNLQLMSAPEWERSEAYLHAYRCTASVTSYGSRCRRPAACSSRPPTGRSSPRRSRSAPPSPR